MSNPIQTAAVAAALSGERAYETVSFPTTGDAEADLMMGVIAVTRLRPNLPRGARSRILRCLADRFEQEEKPIDYSGMMGAQTLGGMGSQGQWQPWNTPPAYETTGGLSGLQGQMQPSSNRDQLQMDVEARSKIRALMGLKD